MNSLDSLYKQLSELEGSTHSLPPVEKWNPPLSGDIDITICENGDWYHDGSLIKRDSLVRLFSSILKKEGDEYFLVTPVEKWRIRVEDAPLLITESHAEQLDDKQCIIVKTRTGDTVVLSDEHPLWMRGKDGEDNKPYIHVRGGLEALVHRNVYYQWVESMVEERSGVHGISSAGSFFALE